MVGRLFVNTQISAAAFTRERRLFEYRYTKAIINLKSKLLVGATQISLTLLELILSDEATASINELSLRENCSFVWATVSSPLMLFRINCKMNHKIYKR